MTATKAASAKASSTRMAILVAAADAFERNGYQGASLAEILDRAGVTKGALYFHFSSKEEIARTILIAHEPALRRRGSEWSALPTVGATLLAAVDVIADELRVDPVARAAVRLDLDPGFQPRPRPPGPFAMWQSVVERIVSDAKSEHRMITTGSARSSAELVVQQIVGILALAPDFEDRDLAARVRTGVKTVLAGIVRKAPGDPLRNAT
jgi:AcrR family transcriptional regulator